MSSVSSVSSSNILTSYYSSTSAADTASETVSETTTDDTEASGVLNEEEVTTLSFSFKQGLVDMLSSISGTGDDDSDSLSGLYEAVEMQQFSKAIVEYYTETLSGAEESTATDSSIDTTA